MMARAKIVMIVLVALCGAFAAAQEGAEVSAGSGNEQLAKLCSGEDVEINRISTVRTLIADVAKAPEGCDEHILRALRALEPVVDSSLDTNACTLNKVNQLRAFHTVYLDRNANPKLPNALRDFVLALGLRLSRQCKMNMVNNLEHDTNELFEYEDWTLFNSWAGKAVGAMNAFAENPKDHDDLLVASEIGRMMNIEKGGPGKLVIKLETVKKVQKLQIVCERRYHPIYSQLILPVVVLSNLGYNYQGEELERELKELSENTVVHKWYRMVYLCESLAGIQLIEDANLTDKRVDSDQVVQLLTPEEAEEVLAKQPSSQAHTSTILNSVPMIQYMADTAMPLEDEVMEAEDTNLVKQVKNFDLKTTQEERAQKKAMVKFFQSVKKVLKTIHVKILRGHKYNNVDAKEDVIKALDSYITEKQDEEKYGIKSFKDIFHPKKLVRFIKNNLQIIIMIVMAIVSIAQLFG